MRATTAVRRAEYGNDGSRPNRITMSGRGARGGRPKLPVPAQAGDLQRLVERRALDPSASPHVLVQLEVARNRLGVGLTSFASHIYESPSLPILSGLMVALKHHP